MADDPPGEEGIEAIEEEIDVQPFEEEELEIEPPQEEAALEEPELIEELAEAA